MRVLATVVLFLWASYSLGAEDSIEQDIQDNLVYVDDFDIVEEAILEMAPKAVILKRVKRKNISRSMRTNLPKGVPVLAFKIYINEVSYETYLGLLIGKEAFFALKFLLASMENDNANCQIAVTELVDRKKPLINSEDIYKYFTKGGQSANQPDKAKCIACEENACQVAGECGHLCICEGCSERLEPKKCPICRAKVTNFLKIYSR